MAKVLASEVSRQLGDAGYPSLDSSYGGRLKERAGIDGKIQHAVVGNLEKGFRSKQDGDDVLTRFYGSPRDEHDMLGHYTRVLENVNLQVAQENDPERDGRRMLRVVKSGN
jgi:hypothetical protein